MTIAADRHIKRVKELPCSCCGQAGPSDAHHIIEGRIPGRRCHDFCTIPVCKDCHQGAHNGIHGQQHMWKVMKKTELECLGQTTELLYGHVK